MYLARKTIKGDLHYFIRETYHDGRHLLSRDLFDLGTDPARFIVYPGGNAFYIDGVVEERIRSLGAEPGPDDFDDIFRSFLKPEIRRALKFYRSRRRTGQSPGTRKDQVEKAGPAHLFDKRRIHYLRYGQVDQGYIGRVSPKLFQVLFDKSRDEIEQYFIEAESILSPDELKTYGYVIFDLQRFFSEMIAKAMPEGLNQNKVDEHFLEEICKLDRDSSFWAGMKTGDRLHEYLARYVIMFFDAEYAKSPFLDEYVYNFMNSKRHQRVYPQSRRVNLDEASTIFGETKEMLKKLSRRDLARLYRKKAQRFHPDKGGEHDKFVELTAAYHDLMKRKPDG
jgi:hypothetical protein